MTLTSTLLISDLANIVSALQEENEALKTRLAEVEKDAIKRLSAGAGEPVAARVWIGWTPDSLDDLEHVYSEDGDGEPLYTAEQVASAVAAERLACAEVCDSLAELNREKETDSQWQWEECAAAIRNRSNHA